MVSICCYEAAIDRLMDVVFFAVSADFWRIQIDGLPICGMLSFRARQKLIGGLSVSAIDC